MYFIVGYFYHVLLIERIPTLFHHLDVVAVASTYFSLFYDILVFWIQYRRIVLCVWTMPKLHSHPNLRLNLPAHQAL